MIRRSGTSEKAGKPRRNRTGAAVVEFAIIAPVMFAVVLGIVEFGRAFMVSNLMTNAAREGARLATLDGATNSLVRKKVEEFMYDSAGVAASDITVAITVNDPEAANSVASAKPGDACTVKVDIPFVKVQYIAGQFLGSTTLSSQVTMRRE